MLEDDKLIWACVEPNILKVRGKDPNTKSNVFAQLSGGQRALFMFQVLYGHMHNGSSRFFDQISYLADHLDIWAALKLAMNYFGESDMAGLIEKMEKAYATKGIANEMLSQLDALYQNAIPAALKRIGEYIRNHPAEFIKFED
jgi:hypothetical protein